MDAKITFPASTEYAGYVSNYITLAQADDLLEGLAASQTFIINLMLDLKAEQLNFRYAPGKWTIKEVLVHLADTERIFAYRALRFARQDKTELPGFDQDDYVAKSGANNRSITNILSEYAAAREATIALYKGFDAEALDQVGTANKLSLSVRALGYTILGHEIHHLRIIRERYLNQAL